MPTEGERGSARLLQHALQEGGRKPKALPPKGKHMPEALLPRDVERRGGREAIRQDWRKLDAPSRADRTEGRAPGSRRKAAGEEIVEAKGPVEAMDTAAGIVAHNVKTLAVSTV